MELVVCAAHAAEHELEQRCKTSSSAPPPLPLEEHCFPLPKRCKKPILLHAL